MLDVLREGLNFTCSVAREKERRKSIESCQVWPLKYPIACNAKTAFSLFCFISSTCGQRQCYQSTASERKCGNNGELSLLKPETQPVNGVLFTIINSSRLFIEFIAPWRPENVTKAALHSKCCHTWQHKANCYEYLTSTRGNVASEMSAGLRRGHSTARFDVFAHFHDGNLVGALFTDNKKSFSADKEDSAIEINREWNLNKQFRHSTDDATESF